MSRQTFGSLTVDAIGRVAIYSEPGTRVTGTIDSIEHEQTHLLGRKKQTNIRLKAGKSSFYLRRDPESEIDIEDKS